MDIFPWGNSTRDGLFLLIIPYFYLPLFGLLSIIYFVKVKYNLNLLFGNLNVHIFIYFLICCLIPNLFDNEITLIIIFLLLVLLDLGKAYLLLKRIFWKI